MFQARMALKRERKDAAAAEAEADSNVQEDVPMDDVAPGVNGLTDEEYQTLAQKIEQSVLQKVQADQEKLLSDALGAKNRQIQELETQVENMQNVIATPAPQTGGFTSGPSTQNQQPQYSGFGNPMGAQNQQPQYSGFGGTPPLPASNESQKSAFSNTAFRPFPQNSGFSKNPFSPSPKMPQTGGFKPAENGESSSQSGELPGATTPVAEEQDDILEYSDDDLVGSDKEKEKEKEEKKTEGDFMSGGLNDT